MPKVKLKKPPLETDLDPPLRSYLESQGYEVRSEVLGCDMTASKEDELVVVELKRGITIDLLAQAAQRQRISDSVYVAVPRADWMGRGKRWRGLKHLLRRLELGLILVAFGRGTPRVEVAFHPGPFTRRRDPKKKRAILREAAGRSQDLNLGGSTQRKLMTAYRECAVHIACCLERHGAMAPKALRDLGTGEKTGSVLYSNHYGWFDRLGRGLYALNEKGVASLSDYPELTATFRARLDAAVEKT